MARNSVLEMCFGCEGAPINTSILAIDFASLLSLIIGAMGVLGSTFLFPMIGAFCKWLVFSTKQMVAETPKEFGNDSDLFDVLIAAHNEEEMLADTIRSVRKAIEKTRNPSRYRIVVGVDASTDRTFEIASQYADEAIDFPLNKSKWKTVGDLVRGSRAEWVALVDAGAIWPERFLQRSESVMKRSDVIGYAPGYRVAGKANFVTRFIWAFERALKRLENSAGGPVSVHGATVLYRRSPLMDALEFLSESPVWHNDDVVVPLVLRASFPEARIVYSSHCDATVEDRGVVRDKAADSFDLNRRLRMAIGNIQWMSTLLQWSFLRNPTAGLLGLRRLFRLFWAWWILFFCGAFLLWALVNEPRVATGTLICIVFGGLALKEMRAAFLVSLISPALFFVGPKGAIKWK